MEKKIRALTGVVVKLPEDFNNDVEQQILNLKKIGVVTTKAELLLKYIRVGYLIEKI